MKKMMVLFVIAFLMVISIVIIYNLNTNASTPQEYKGTLVQNFQDDSLESFKQDGNKAIV